jgi:preprotein translocase subunit SecA
VRAGLIGAIERRVGASLGLKAEFKGDDSWDDIRQQLMDAAEKTHKARAEKSLTEIERELKDFPNAPTPGKLLLTLVNMAYGTTTAFDQKTHRKIALRTQRLVYFYSTAEMIEDWTAAELKADLLAHLRGAFDALNRIWGEAEFRRLGGTPVAGLPEAARAKLLELKPEAEALTVHELGDEAQMALGKQALTPALRQLMLAVIGQLWVEYLTSVEALRTSIGLEAYAQRDPLVAYKGRASEMFAELLNNMRAGVVARAFTFRPRVEAPAPVKAQPAGAGKPGGAGTNGGRAASPAGGEQVPAGGEASGGKKRRRRR